MVSCDAIVIGPGGDASAPSRTTTLAVGARAAAEVSESRRLRRSVDGGLIGLMGKRDKPAAERDESAAAAAALRNLSLAHEPERPPAAMTLAAVAEEPSLISASQSVSDRVEVSVRAEHSVEAPAEGYSSPGRPAAILTKSDSSGRRSSESPARRGSVPGRTGTASRSIFSKLSLPNMIGAGRRSSSSSLASMSSLYHQATH